MIKAKVNGEPVDIETSYEELSFRKYVKLFEKGIYSSNFQVNQSEVLSVFLGIPTEVIRKANFQGLDEVLRAISFLNKEPEIEKFPTRLGQLTLPQNILNESIEQFETMEAEVIKAGTIETIPDKLRAMALYCGIYCQPAYSESQGQKREFDLEKAQFLAEQIMDYPCQEVMSAGTFYTQLSEYKKTLRDELPVQEYSSEEEAAGFRRISETFGFYATLDNIARYMGITDEQALKLTVNQFYTKVKYLAWRAHAQKELQRILNPKKDN